MRIRKDISRIMELLLLLLCFVGITMSFTIGNFGMALAIILLGGIFFYTIYKCFSKIELSSVLAVPIMLSAFQNVYLGFFSPKLSSTYIQILTVFNFLYASIIFVFLFIQRYKLIQKNHLLIVFVLLILYSVFSLSFVSSINVISVVSSMRNIISVFIFFFIGVMASKRLNMDRLQKIMIYISIVVVLAGLYETIINRNMWNTLNITDLWTKKGIRVQSSGLPTNFYSSERIHGERIRRMTSTFADPVNLGAFLYAGLCIAWYRKAKLAGACILLAIVLTVSKGALLGILIFFCVYAYYYTSKPLFYSVLGFSALGGILFLFIAMRTSANSVFLHLSGFAAAFKSMISNPLGSGVGSNGVLARQFSGFSANSDITETGLGMIIGQLGFVGLIIFVYFFYKIYKSSLRLVNKRETVLCVSLVLSVIANIFFNEVALSPNSCAIYFLIVGYYVAKAWRQKGMFVYALLDT